MTTTTDTKPVDATALAIIKNLEQVQGAITEFNKIEAGFTELQATHPANLACAVDTPKGMKEAIAGRAAWREPRIATEKARKAAKAPVLALGKDIDARAAAITLRLEAGEANYDEQIKAEEARKEAERQAKVQQEVQRVSDLQVRVGELRGAIAAAAGAPAALILEHIQDLVAVPVDATFQEFQQQAEEAKASTLARLREMHAAALANEAEQARIIAEREELARLRAEQDARDKAERERIAAEQRAEADRLAQQRDEIDRRERAAAAEIERQQAAQRAEQQRLDAEAAAARKAADDQARAEREAEDRAARAAHAAEQQRLDAQAAELRQQQEAAAEARRAQVEREEAAKWEAQCAASAEKQRLTAAAPLMLDALRQWHIAELTNDSAEMAAARIARDAALEAAGEVVGVAA